MLLLIDLNGQLNFTHMGNELNRKLDFIDFNISPLNRRVQFVVVKDEPTFNHLLIKFDGKPIEISNSKSKKELQNEANLFQLSNNMILVDQYELKKSNPYYVCNSLEDYLFIRDNFFIFRTEPDQYPIVEYRIHLDHIRIKEFLSRDNVHFLKFDTSSNQEIYKTNDNKFIVTKYIPNSSTKKENPFNVISSLFVKPENANDSLIYIELTMFESFEMMQKSGILESPGLELSESITYSKKLFVPGSKEYCTIKVMNSEGAKELLSSIKGYDLTLKFNSLLDDSKKLSDGRVLASYSENLYLLFNTEQEFREAYDYLRESVAAQLSNERIENLIDAAKRQLLNNSIGDMQKYLTKLKISDKTNGENLKEIDSEINTYFWDNLFITERFSDILGLIGAFLNKRNGGGWKEIVSSERIVYQTRSGEELDIIPYFLEEAMRQQFTGYCSLERIVSTLMISSKLKVGRMGF
jgi:hypothetical protein